MIVYCIRYTCFDYIDLLSSTGHVEPLNSIVECQGIQLSEWLVVVETYRYCTDFCHLQYHIFFDYANICIFYRSHLNIYSLHIFSFFSQFVLIWIIRAYLTFRFFTIITLSSTMPTHMHIFILKSS